LVIKKNDLERAEMTLSTVKQPGKQPPGAVVMGEPARNARPGPPDSKVLLRELSAGRTWCGRDATLKWAERCRVLLAAAKASRAERPGPGGEKAQGHGPDDREPIVSARYDQPVPGRDLATGTARTTTEGGDAGLF
jgi:hypothetical protein